MSKTLTIIKKLMQALCIAFVCAGLTACQGQIAPSKDFESDSGQDNTPPLSYTVSLCISGQSFSVELFDNPSARDFLRQIPAVFSMRELNGNEKFIYLSNNLPQNAEQVGVIRAGDIMLYGSNCLVIFYKSFSTPYRYTRLGRIEQAERLSQAVGGGDIDICFSALLKSN